MFPGVLDVSKSIELTCYDYDNPMKSDLIGKAIIPLRDFVDKKYSSKWYPLGNKLGENDELDRGELEVQVQWQFNPTLNAELKKRAAARKNSVFNKISTLVKGEEEDVEDEDGDGGGDLMTPDVTPQTEAQAKAAEEARKVIDFSPLSPLPSLSFSLSFWSSPSSF